MATYDKYYEKENLFGAPYPELIAYFTGHHKRGSVLDIGCGQGRDAIALARLGYSVTGIDISQVGIDQMIEAANHENLDVVGLVADLYTFDDFQDFDFILLDSMFHFTKTQKQKEVDLIKRIWTTMDIGAKAFFCIQDTGNKVSILNQLIDASESVYRLSEEKFQYTFEDSDSSHKSVSDYKMIVVEKAALK